ncbi:MAG: hypothetical protein GQ583_08485, partial [Methyloprofundus sp.]|nr:hypothetical protein [Methyloprofundus sp.]
MDHQNNMSNDNNTSLARLKDFIFVQKCIPWSISNRFKCWLELKAHFNSPSLYTLIKYGRLKNIVSPLTKGPQHHFFGYYEKTPWNKSGNKILSHQASFNDRPPNAGDKVQIGYISTTQLPGDFVTVAETSIWNWQQGAMLQWSPTDPENTIIYNDYREGRYISIQRDLSSNDEVIYDLPAYALTQDGQYIFSLNFARLFDKRPGYGYAGLADPFAEQKHPDKDGIFRLDTQSG